VPAVKRFSVVIAALMSCMSLKQEPLLHCRRQCVGMAFAKMNYTSVLARLMGTFTFELAQQMGGSQGVMEAENYAITLMPSKGMWMHCRSRVKQATAVTV